MSSDRAARFTLLTENFRHPTRKPIVTVDQVIAQPLLLREIQNPLREIRQVLRDLLHVHR